MDEFIKILSAIDWSKYRVVINIAGSVIFAGQEIIEILKKSGMNQIEYLEIVQDQNAQIAINRARLVKSIEDREDA